MKKNLFFKQGSIINVIFDPTHGHEQKGHRPAVVVGNNPYSDMTSVMPVTQTPPKKPTLMKVSLDERTHTNGYVMIDQCRSMDLASRNAKLIEALPDDLLDEILERHELIFNKNN